MINVVPGEDALASSLLKQGYVVTRIPHPPDVGGDVSFEGVDSGGNAVTIGVERKTISDLLASWVDGRLTDQLRRMVHNYDVVILAVSGDLSPKYSTQPRKRGRVDLVPTTPVMNELVRWQARGVIVVPCEDVGDRIAELYALFKRQETSTDPASLEAVGQGDAAQHSWNGAEAFREAIGRAREGRRG